MLGDSIKSAINGASQNEYTTLSEDEIRGLFQQRLAEAVVEYVDSISERRQEWRDQVIQEMFKLGAETMLTAYQFAENLERLKGE